jgi:hypothetical protein
MGGLTASRQMRVSPAPPQVATRPALCDQDGNGQGDEQRDQRGQDHDQQEDQGAPPILPAFVCPRRMNGWCDERNRAGASPDQAVAQFGARRGLRFRPRAAVSAQLRRPARADQGERPWVTASAALNCCGMALFADQPPSAAMAERTARSHAPLSGYDPPRPRSARPEAGGPTRRRVLGSGSQFIDGQIWPGARAYPAAVENPPSDELNWAEVSRFP